MSGVVESLSERVDDLEKTVAKLCARLGHENSGGWVRCGVTLHRRDTESYENNPVHGRRCDTCGVMECLQEPPAHLNALV